MAVSMNIPYFIKYVHTIHAHQYLNPPSQIPRSATVQTAHSIALHAVTDLVNLYMKCSTNSVAYSTCSKCSHTVKLNIGSTMAL